MAITKRGPVTALTPEGRDLGLSEMFELLGSRICEHANKEPDAAPEPARGPGPQAFNR